MYFLNLILEKTFMMNNTSFTISSSFQNPCASTPCDNKATCQTGFTPKGYRCLCHAGYTGQDCKTGKKNIAQAVNIYIFFIIFN